MLRYRRVDLILELSLLAALALGLLGILVVIVLDPLGLLVVIGTAAAAGLVLGRLIGERRVGGLILGAVIALLATGLYAIYLLLDLPLEWAAGLAGAVLVLFGVVLARAVLATADEPPP